MSSANNATKPTNAKGETNHPSSSHRKTAAPATRPPDHAAAAMTALKCPRCDSPNTKFCYYNNYSLTQPRHFCKTCRRYWTKGGALRNVPVGGGCRKNKKLKSAASSKDSMMTTSSSSSSDHHHQLLIGGTAGGLMNLKLFHGISPAMDFQLGGLQTITNNNNPLSSSANLIGGFDYDHHHPLSLASGSSTISTGLFRNNIMTSTSNNSASSAHGSLATSIESLSSINQDLHWKLQQQRLAMLFGHSTSTVGGQYGNSQLLIKESSIAGGTVDYGTAHKPESQRQTAPILFQNLEISKPSITDHRDDNDRVDVFQARKDQVVFGTDQTAANSMEWFFGINSFNSNNNNSGQNLAHHHHVNSAQTPTNSGSNGNENVTNWNNVNGVQAWTASTADLHQFSAALP